MDNMYRFIFESGQVQDKIMIPHYVWETYKELLFDKAEQQMKANKYLKSYTFGKEWFTDKSPYYDAISTGVFKYNGVEIKVNVIKL